MPSEINSPTRANLPAGCLLTLLSAAFTCTLLFVNGAIVFACLRGFAKMGTLVRDPRVMQFLLLFVPVVLVVLQWMALDYLRNKFWRRSGSSK